MCALSTCIGSIGSGHSIGRYSIIKDSDQGQNKLRTALLRSVRTSCRTRTQATKEAEREELLTVNSSLFLFSQCFSHT